MKRNRALAGLAAACALLAALIWWDRRLPSTDERARALDRLLPGFARAAADAVEVERRGATTRLRHQADGWWLAEPRRRADDAAVETLLAVLEYGQVERRIGDVDAALRHRLGLDAPRVVVRVAGHTLIVGGDDPARGVYVQRDAEPAALVAEHRLVEAADLDPRLWRSLRPTLREPAEARSIATTSWALERNAGWRVTRPVIARAADAKVDALVQALARARATAEVASAPPLGESLLLSLDGAPQATVGKELVERADGARLRFAPADLGLLRAPASTFYERRLFPLRLDDIVAADVGPLELRRENGAWRIIAPPAAVGPARDEAVRAWLAPLLAAEAGSFSTAAVGEGTRVRLATHDDELAATVAGRRARRAGETVTLELGAPLSPSSDAAPLRGSL